MEKQTLFISYCQKDGDDYANELQSQLKDEFDVKRDKSGIKVNEDLFNFMSEIANCDNVVIVLTSGYLKSLNCMLEISYLMSQVDRAVKAMVLVVDESIYTLERQIEVINYWQLKQKRNARMTVDVGKGLIERDQKRLDSICEIIEGFLDSVAKRKNPSQIAVVNEIIKMSKRDRQPERILIKKGEEFVADFLKENGQMTLAELCDKSEMDMARAHRYVRNLMDKGVVQASGSQRAMYYSRVDNK